MKFLMSLLSCLLVYKAGISQTDQREVLFSDSAVLFTDTIESKSGDYRITHYHKVSRLLRTKMIMDADSIFNEGFNDFSRLIFTTYGHSFNVPSIPLTHVIFLEKAKLILGLSKIAVSPYHIVVYSLEGKLLFKAKLTNLELKVNKPQLRSLLKKYPPLYKCLSQMTIVKENDFYCLELSPCIINTIGRDSIRTSSLLSSNHYFPLMNSPIHEGGFYYTQYYSSFSSSDPLYDLIMIGSVPYLLILNGEDGTKVNIPLQSNCDIFKELQE